MSSKRSNAFGERTKVRIKISCRDLPVFCKSSCASISVATCGYVHNKDITKTEIQHDTRHPTFKTTLVTQYTFEEMQIINVTVYFLEDGSMHELGHADYSLGRVIHGGGQHELKLRTKMDMEENCPKLTIQVEEFHTCKEHIVLKLQGYGLDKKDLFGKSDPYITIEKKADRGKLSRICRTEVVRNNLNPEWKPITLSLDELCECSKDSELEFCCFDWDGANGDPEDKDTEFDELIGTFTTTAQELLTGKKKQFQLINHRKQKKKKGYSHSGLVTVECTSSSSQHTFLDYMFSGTDLNFSVAIDLTSSNGAVEHSNSLHNMDASNEYAIAIQAVLEVIQDYDNDQLFPAVGFGAFIPSLKRVHHEYPLNGDFQNPFCKGAEGVLEAYRRTLREVILSEPTYFSPVIRHVCKLTEQYQDGSHYFILLILTDGTVDDWNETCKAVIEASYMALSIIVVGIGKGPFTEMEVLDQDDKLLKFGPDTAIRDNVQFIPMRHYLRAAADGSDHMKWNKAALAKDVLKELPRQVLDYMHLKNIKPLTKRPQSIQPYPLAM